MSETENKSMTNGHAKRSKEEILEIVIAIFLGLTAFMVAWASWISSLHGGNMSTNYTKSNNLSIEGNAMWTEASQQMMQDMQVWNLISEFQVGILYGDAIEDEDRMQENAHKIQFICADNLTQDMAAMIDYDFEFDMDQIIDWVLNNEKSTTSPFDNEEFVDKYFEEASTVLDQSEAAFQEGLADNAKGDKYNLVTVIYSVVLFMLGIVGTFRRLPNRMLITIIAVIGFFAGTIYMFSIPMPTGFNLLSFFVK